MLAEPAVSTTLYVALENCRTGVSLARIVSTAVLGAPSAAPPPGADNVRLMVSAASVVVSFRMGTRKVFVVSVAANVSVPAAAVRSEERRVGKECRYRL